MPEPNIRLIPQWNYRELGNEDWSTPDYYVAQRNVGGGYVEEAQADARGNIVGPWQRHYAPATGGDEGVWKSFQSELLSNPAVTLPALLLGAQAAGFVPGADAVQPGVFGGTQAASATPASYATWEGDDAVLGDSFRRNSVDSIYNTWEADDAALGKTWSNLGLPALGAAGAAAGGAAALKGAAGAGGAAAGTAAGTTALSRLLGMGEKGTDLTSVLGQLGATGLGMYGAREQTQALRDLAEKEMAAQSGRFQTLLGREDDAIAKRDAAIAEGREMGAPYRQRLSDLYADPTSFLSSPEVQVPVQLGTDALARSLSVQGNPYDNPGAQQEIHDYTAKTLFGRLGDEKNRLATLGGIPQYNAAGATVPGIGTNLAGFGSQAGFDTLTKSIATDAGMYNALGYGLGNITNPPEKYSLADLLKMSKGDIFKALGT